MIDTSVLAGERPTIARRLVCLLAPLACATSLVLVLHLHGDQPASPPLREDGRGEALRVAEIAYGELREVVDQARLVLGQLAALPAVRNRDRAECDRVVERLIRQLDGFTLVGAVDLDGVPICSSARADRSVADGPFFFERVFETESFQVGEYIRGSGTTHPLVSFGAPVFDETGRPNGAVFASLDLAWLAQRLESRRAAYQAASVTIADRTARVLVQVPQNHRLVGTRLAEADWPRVYANAPGAEAVVDETGDIRAVAYIPIGQQLEAFYVGVEMTVAPTGAPAPHPHAWVREASAQARDRR